MVNILTIAWLVSVATDLVASIVYLVWSKWRAGRASTRAADHVRFEALWGMVLALPALLAVLATTVDSESRSPWSLLLLLGVTPLYALPVLALVGRKLPTAARWYPAVVAIGALPVSVVLGAAAGYGVFWLIFFVPIATRLGVGYAADCLVSLRFARAVSARDSERQRESANLQLTPAPG